MEDDESNTCSGTLLFYGFPDTWHIGVDLKMWQMTSKFYGIRNVPMGLHYIYYSDPQDCIRQGFFHTLEASNEISVWKWDPSVESFSVPRDVGELCALQYRAQGDMDVISGILDYHSLVSKKDIEQWERNSGQITRECVGRIQPAGEGTFRSTQQPYGENPAEWSAQGSPQIYWTPIPRIPISGITAEERSQMHMDTEYLLGRLLTVHSEQEVMGELQAAYILFLLGQNYEGFLQYKRLVSLLLSCGKRGICDHLLLFSEFLGCLATQLDDFPEDFLLESENSRRTNPTFLLALIARFLATVGESDMTLQRELEKQTDAIDIKLRRKFGNNWKLEATPEDDDPVVVEEVAIS